MTEQWKPVVGYEHTYEVSDKGNVRSIARKGSNNKTYGGIVRKQCTNIWGYKHVCLYQDGTERTRTVHRMVAEAFIPNPDNLPCINHKDEDKTNNSVGNLEWCTYKYNSNYGTQKNRASDKKAMPVIGTDADGVEHWYRSSRDAAEAITGKRQRTHITECCNGKRPHAYGCTWRYASV